MGWLRNATVTCFLLALSISTTLMLCVILDNKQLFPTAAMKRPLPLVLNELYPSEVKLLDLSHFRFLINNDVCAPNNESLAVAAVIVVTSHAGDVEARSAIRQAYPIKKLLGLGVRRVFLLAVPSRDNKYTYVSQNALLDENNRYSDLVQGDFQEAYRNLTYKHVMGLHWAVAYCPNAHYIIKMDDDIIVDLYQLMDMLRRQDENKLSLMGYLLRGTIPVREPASKWYVTHEEYPNAHYPPFLSGWLYVTTPKVAELLVKTSGTERYFWIDDTFVTGILAHKAGVGHQDIKDRFTLHAEYIECCLTVTENVKYTCDFIVGPNGGNSKLLERFQEYAARCHELHCPRRPEEKMLLKTCVSKPMTPAPKRGKAQVEPIDLF